MKKSQKNVILFVGVTLIIILLSTIALQKEISNKNGDLKLIVKNLYEEKWSYEIYNHNKLFIKQESIPAFTGNIYFTSKADAEAVGSLVLKKIIKGENPSVSISDLENLGINTIN